MNWEWHSLCCSRYYNLKVMKAAVTLAVLFFLALTPAFGQADIINNIKDAIKAGSAREISVHLNQTVDVTLEGNIENYSRTQAEYQLKEFFQQYPPSTFQIVHQGASKAGMPYAIGQYVSGESTFRVWIRIKQISEEYKIHEISFIKE